MGYRKGSGFNNSSDSNGSGGGGGNAGVVALVALGSQPSTPYVRGSRWYYNGKIYTALTTTTADDGVVPDTDTAYLYNGTYYYWDGTTLQGANEENLVHKSGTETITGDKTFTGETKAVTPPFQDISTKVATTEFVFEQVEQLYESATELGILIKYDGTITRLGAAAGMNFSPSSDTTEGVDDFKDHPVFNKFKCVVNYNAQTGVRTMYPEGTHEYEQHKNTVGWDSFVAKRVFFVKGEITDAGLEVRFRAAPKEGFDAPAAFYDDDGNLKEYVYYSEYEVCYAEGQDDNGSCVRKNCIPLTNKTNQQFEELLRAKDQRLMNLNEITVIQLLGILKYASLNWQQSVGQGISSGWKETKVAVAQTNADSIIILATNWVASLSQDIEHNVVYVDSNGIGHKMVSVEDVTETIDGVETACKKINIDAEITTTVNQIIYLGLKTSGGAEDILGDDGYFTANGEITTAERRPIKILGICDWFANEWKAIGGMENIVADGVATVYVNPKPNNSDYAYTDTTNNKNWTVVGTIGVSEGYNKKFVPSADLALFAFLPSNTAAGSGTTTKYFTGDYSYLTSSAGQKSCFYGGHCAYGAVDGGFYLNALNGLGYAHRSIGARCVLK